MEVLQRTANRGSISDGGYDIPFSCKFEQDNSERMTRTATQSTAGDSRKTWTFSGWIKRTEFGNHVYIFSAGGTGFQILDNEQLRFALYYNNTSYYLDTNMRLEDPSAWYHIVGQLDTTQSTAQDRVKIWINGVRQTSFSNDTAHNIPQNADVQHINEATGTSTAWLIINDWYASGRFFRGYSAEYQFTDGVANDADAFGEYDSDSNIWVPIEYTGSYGTNGFYLDFADGDDLGDDESGNGNDFSEGNLTALDQSIDTPTNNFCTLNLQQPNYANTGGATEGGTSMNVSGINQFYAYYGTQGFTKGKWYWEAYIVSRSGSYGLTNEMGVHTMENIILTSPYYANAFKTNYYLNFHYGYTYAWDSGTKGSKNSEDGVPQLGSSSVGKWVGLAFNADDGEATWYLDGSQMGNANLDIYDLHDKMQEGIFGVPFFQVYHNDLNVNFGGYSSQAISSGNTDANGYGNFEYAPPTGYYAICTKNLAEFG